MHMDDATVRKHLLPIALAAMDKHHDDLTDQEKVAIAVTAGLPYTVTRNDKPGVRIDIVPRVAFERVCGVIKVYSEALH